MPGTAAMIRTDADTLFCSGCWSVNGISVLSAGLDTLDLPRGDTLKISGEAITTLDTAGAWLLLQIRQRMASRGAEILLEDFRPEHNRLVDYVSTASEAAGSASTRRSTHSLDSWQ